MYSVCTLTHTTILANFSLGLVELLENKYFGLRKCVEHFWANMNKGTFAIRSSSEFRSKSFSLLTAI
jgi:hypothetical protein